MTKKITISFLIWRIALFFVAFIAIFAIPTFGARFPYYDTILELTKLPNWIWGFGNFDGVHYLKIAYEGYLAQNSQAFFPVFPFLIKLLNVFPRDVALDPRYFIDPSFFYTGLILSNAFCLLFLVYFYKLLRLDFSRKSSFISLILLLGFPTAFYLGSIYSESLFLFLSVASIYLFRKEKYLFSGILAMLASATRVFGVFLFLIFAIEMITSWKETDIHKNWLKIGVAVSPILGILLYMFYLRVNYGDPLLFAHVQSAFGAQREGSSIVFLPQVIYRYFKIITTVDLKSLAFINSITELVFTLVPLSLFVFFYKRTRKSYLVYSLAVLLFPTLTGTLSSMPRYILAAFPLFPLLSVLIKKNYIYLVVAMVVLQIVLLSMFIRGYWVA